MVRSHSGHTLTALLIVLIGLLLLASTIELFATDSLWSWAPLLFVLQDAWIETWWPLFVILLGLLLLDGRSRRRAVTAVDSGDVSAIAIFGGVESLE